MGNTNNELRMDADELHKVANNVHAVSGPVQVAADHAKKLEFKGDSLGSLPLSEVAGTLSEAVQALGASVEKVSEQQNGYLAKMSEALGKTASSTKMVDEDNAWVIKKSAQGN